MYSRAVGAMVLVFVVALVVVSSMPSAMASYSGKATYIDYNPVGRDWEMNTVDCSSLIDSYYNRNFRSRHRWVEFCGSLGPYTGDCGCHKCLEVTNAATSDDASVTVRIIEICDPDFVGDLVLWMDKGAFDEIDTDGQGAALGGQGDARLDVNYQIVDCQDD